MFMWAWAFANYEKTQSLLVCCKENYLHNLVYITISKNEFESLNWLPVKDRFNQSINLIVLKYFTK